MGSVKEVRRYGLDPTEKDVGLGRFRFSDDYSVFDWGKMPDTIPNKGVALSLMGAHFFERAEEQGIKTHYRGLVSRSKGADVMDIRMVQVIKPEFVDGRYDYSIFTPNLRTFLIPLEFIYRNSLPRGSSVFKRLEREELTTADLGLDHNPGAGEILPWPFLDVSTKLEERDRYLTWKGAQDLAGLTDSEVEEIKMVLLKGNLIITYATEKAHLFNGDGKLEFAYDPDRRLMVVDVAGTSDECRLIHGGKFNVSGGITTLEGGFDVSKQVARDVYKETQWYVDIENAKRLAEEQGIKDWKKDCLNPPGLPDELIIILSQMYMSTANAILRDVFGRNVFRSPHLDDVVEECERHLRSTVHKEWLRVHGKKAA